MFPIASSWKRLLVSIILFQSNATVDAQSATSLDNTHTNATRSCGQHLGVVTRAQVRAIGRKLLSSYVDASLLERSMDIIFLPVEFDFNVVRLCASCRDHNDWYFELGGGLLKFPGYHAEYCASSTPYYDIQLSSLVFLPRDPSNGNNLPNGVRMRTFLSLLPTRADPSVTPTVEWPTDGIANVEELDANFIARYLPGIVAASAGAISLLPDMPGRGESKGVAPNTILHRLNYEFATAVSYLGLKKYVGDVTGQCTLLDNAATVHGVEDGAFAAPYATQILQRFNVQGLSTFAQAGPMDIEVLLQTVLQNPPVDGSDLAALATEWTQMSAYTLSADLHGTANSGSGDYLVNESWRESLIQRYGIESDPTVELPDSAKELLATKVRVLYEAPTALGYSACNNTIFGGEQVTGAVSIAGDDPTLCKAILESTAKTALLRQKDLFWISPLDVCYSDDDTLVAPAHFENPSLQENEDLQLLWNRYTRPKGFDTLDVLGDHAQTVQLCSISPLLYFTLQGHQPDEVENRGNYRPSMDASELAKCQPVTGAPSPAMVTDTEAPVPTVSPDPTLTRSPTKAPFVSSTSATGGDATGSTGNGDAVNGNGSGDGADDGSGGDSDADDSGSGTTGSTAGGNASNGGEQTSSVGSTTFGIAVSLCFSAGYTML